jgi:hypothetical protein
MSDLLEKDIWLKCCTDLLGPIRGVSVGGTLESEPWFHCRGRGCLIPVDSEQTGKHS